MYICRGWGHSFVFLYLCMKLLTEHKLQDKGEGPSVTINRMAPLSYQINEMP